MKSNLFFIPAIAASAALAAPVMQAGPAPPDMTVKISGMTREQQGHIVSPGGTAPEVQELKPLYADYVPGLKRKKVRNSVFFFSVLLAHI